MLTSPHSKEEHSGIEQIVQTQDAKDNQEKGEEDEEELEED